MQGYANSLTFDSEMFVEEVEDIGDFFEDLIPDEEEENYSDLLVDWNIETKYYKARVYFWIDETVGRNDINWEVVTGYLDEDNGIGDVVDAIIFVFRKDEPSTFEDIHTFLPFIKRYEPSITLANGFEYVDLEETKSQDGFDRACWNRSYSRSTSISYVGRFD
ncbi:4833_t:CDS:2 [Entrophospora sp. SA101]|nr:4833_t:CDS:2 [Entrophospora sp. SA101]